MLNLEPVLSKRYAQSVILSKLPFFTKINITEDEQSYLHDILPPVNVIIGFGFVTWLTLIKTKSHEIVSSLNM
jgi:hypothetical protein